MDDSWQKFYNHYAPILDLSVTDKLVLRPEVLAAYNALQLQRQTMAAVDVYAKCRWQAEVVEDTFEHVFGEDTLQEIVAYSRSFVWVKRLVIYAISSPEVLARIGRKLQSPEEEENSRQEALRYLAEHPDHRPSFYTAQDKVYIAVMGNSEDKIVSYYLRNFEGPEYPLSYFCAQKPNCTGALMTLPVEYVLFLWEKGILKIAEGQRSCTP